MEKEEKKKKGRKVKGEEKKRLIDKTVAYNKEEMAIILKKAERLRLKPIPYIREASLHYNEDTSPKITVEFTAQLRKIGINVNQIAKKLNEIKHEFQVKNLKEIEKSIEEYKEILHNIYEKVK